MKQCPFCSAEIEDDGIKCPRCSQLVAGGNPFDIREACTECGTAIPANRGFCPKCGVIQIRKVSGRQTIMCPSCHSAQVEKISAAKKAGYVALLGLFAPALKSVRSQFKCNACGNKW